MRIKGDLIETEPLLFKAGKNAVADNQVIQQINSEQLACLHNLTCYRNVFRGRRGHHCRDGAGDKAAVLQRAGHTGANVWLVLDELLRKQ